MPRCLIIAGPNGAGKTTFARDFLPKDALTRFINTDLIAAGISPLDPSLAQIAAGRIFLAELDRAVAQKIDFAFESTLSGLTYLPRLRTWKASGYMIEIVYLKLDDVRISLERIARRVKEGGHHVPEVDARRRFERSWNNFVRDYGPLADHSTVFNVTGATPVLVPFNP